MPHSTVRSFALACLALLLGGCPALHAAEGKLTILGIGNAFPQFALKDGQGWQTITVEPFLKSPEYTVPYQSRLALYPLEPGESTPAEDAVPISVQIPPRTDRVLVLLIEKEPGSYAAVAIDNAVDSFPMGKARLINLCTHPVAVRPKDGGLIQLRPGGQSLVEGNGKVLNLDIAFLHDGEWKMVGNRILGLRPHNRASIFIIGTHYNHFAEGTAHGSVSAVGPVEVLVIRD